MDVERATPTREQALRSLGRLVGTWTSEATHPAMPGAVLRGTASCEWLDGKRFLIQRMHVDHPDFPDAICIIGFTDRDRVDDQAAHPGGEGAKGKPAAMTMHYFDARGVFRVFETSIDDQAWRGWNDAPGFSQRFTATFGEDGNTIDARWQLRRDDVHWNDDMRVTYRRGR